MSLLLDALQRASKEKEKLADARASASDAAVSGTQAQHSPLPTPASDPEPALSASPAAVAPRAELSLAPDIDYSDPLPDPGPSLDFPELTDLPPVAAVGDSTPPGLKESPPDRPSEWAPAAAEPTAGNQPPAGDIPAPTPPVLELPAGSVAAAPKIESALGPAPASKPTPARVEPAAPIRPSAETAGSARPSAPAHPSPVISSQVAREILGATAKPAKQGPNRRLIVLGAVVLVVAAVNAAFFLGFMDKFLGIAPSGLTPALPPAPLAMSAPPPAAPVEAAPAEGAGVSDSSSSPNAPAAAPEAATATTAARSPDAGSRKHATASTTPRDEATGAFSDVAAAKPAQRATGARSVKPVFSARPGAVSALDNAYAALTEDRLDDAARAYQQALQKNSGERDAMLGLAYIAQRQGNKEEARTWYQRVLRQDPGNPAANAGMLTIAAEGDLQTTASRAREVAERNPNSAVVLSTLGGLLAREGRIGEAQQVYFRALTLEPDNALYAYNLAVALDRLHKYAQATTYYQRALVLAEKSGAGERANFPRKETLRRLEQLHDSNEQALPSPESSAR